jgi:hypothetical protein
MTVRDPEMIDAVGKALAAGPARWNRVSRLPPDTHEPGTPCWLHRHLCCFSTM